VCAPKGAVVDWIRLTAPLLVQVMCQLLEAAKKEIKHKSERRRKPGTTSEPMMEDDENYLFGDSGDCEGSDSLFSEEEEDDDEEEEEEEEEEKASQEFYSGSEEEEEDDGMSDKMQAPLFLLLFAFALG